MTDAPSAGARRRPPSRRSLRTADVMIFVAVLAAAFAASGSIADATLGFVSWPQIPSQLEFIRKMAALKPPSSLNLANAVSGLVLHLWMLSAPFVVSMTIALIPIRLISPRPRWRRAALQPGTVAACAAVLAMSYVGTLYGTVRFVATKDPELTAGDAAFALMCLTIFVGFSIIAAWTTLLAAGLWRTDPTWIDRLGRIVAVVWIAAGLFNTCHYLIFGLHLTVGSTIIFY